MQGETIGKEFSQTKGDLFTINCTEVEFLNEKDELGGDQMVKGNEQPI